MSLAELVDLIRQRLGQGTAFYPTALLVTFCQYAQNLLALQASCTVRQRAAYTLEAGELLIDLRALVPRYLHLRRVELGDTRTQEASRALGRVQPLFRTTLQSLAARGRWFETLGVPRQYFRQGRTLLGVYPRPSATTTITVLTTSLPTPFSMADLAQESEIQASNHPLIADVATGLLLIREGTLESAKGLQMLQSVLSDQQMAAMTKTVDRLHREAQRGASRPPSLAPTS